jgi:hypothetical protein
LIIPEANKAFQKKERKKGKETLCRIHLQDQERRDKRAAPQEAHRSGSDKVRDDPSLGLEPSSMFASNPSICGSIPSCITSCRKAYRISAAKITV